MRGFFARGSAPPERILLIESGPRSLGARTVERLRAVFPDAAVDAVCCTDSAPAGVGRVWRVQEYSGRRSRLVAELRREGHTAAALLAGGDPIMAPWRWALLAALPAKFLIVNENADFFWLDRGNLRTLSLFVRHRSGIEGESLARAVGRAAALPFAFVYLLLYAGWVHTARAVRLTLGWKHRARA